MTEEEAKARRCCGPSDAGVAVLRSEMVEIMRDEKTVSGLAQRVTVKDRMCAGSACMAWRWASERTEFGQAPSATEGYCGLAGKP